MATNNSANQDFSNNSDGFTLGGGTTERKLTVTGGDTTLTASGSAVITFPASSDTLVGRNSTDAVKNKDLTDSSNTFSIGPSSLATGGAHAIVTTNQSTTSSTYGDLTTAGPSVTVTIGPNGLALLFFGAEMANNTAGDYADMTIVVSGANTIAAGTNPYRLFTQGTSDNKSIYATLMTGLSAGSTTFKCQYRVIAGGTASFQQREISVIPL